MTIPSNWQDKLDISPREFGRVGVLMGGYSNERDVSLKSGKAICSALVESGVNATPVDVTDCIPESVSGKKFDRVFIALHGRGGEDGAMQAVLDWSGIPYTGSGVLGSALAMNKQLSKDLVEGAGLLSPRSLALTEQTQASDAFDYVGLPMAVKPISEGSSIGVSKVSSLDQFDEAKKVAFQADSNAMAESWVTGKEITVGILAGIALPSITLQPESGFYDYDAKYISSNTKYICPSEISEALEAELQTQSKKIFELLKLKGWGRVDFIVDKEEKCWFIEANTVPGMTNHSLVPMAAKQAGLSFGELCRVILAQTFEH